MLSLEKYGMSGVSLQLYHNCGIIVVKETARNFEEIKMDGVVPVRLSVMATKI